jgi:hypothetical protein
MINTGWRNYYAIGLPEKLWQYVNSSRGNQAAGECAGILHLH